MSAFDIAGRTKLEYRLYLFFGLSIGGCKNYLSIFQALTASSFKGRIGFAFRGGIRACSSADRVSASGAEGLAFESPQARHMNSEEVGMFSRLFLCVGDARNRRAPTAPIVPVHSRCALIFETSRW